MKNKLFIFLFLFAFLSFPLASQAESLAVKLQGKILLQVEQNGEAWYVNPDDEEKYYLGRPTDAFNLMRELGLGVSNKDFESFGDYAPARLAGRILLKVEANGEAYYVNPVDLKMHFLGRPADAFSVMRNLGLGVTNNNLNMIGTRAGHGIEDTVVSKKIEVIVPGEETTKKEDVATSTEEIVKEDSQETASSTAEVVEGETASSTDEMIKEEPLPVCEFTAEYFDNDRLSGYPKLTKTTTEINYDWWTGKPEGFNYNNEFSVRWTSNCDFSAGTYKFIANFDDGMRVYIDGKLVIDSWDIVFEEQKAEAEVNLEAGTHEIIVEYFEYKLNAMAKFYWERV